MHHETALEVAGNAFVPAHGEEQQGNHATVAVPGGQDVFGNVFQRGILSGRCPGIGRVDVREQGLGLLVGVVNALRQRIGQGLDTIRKDDVFLPLGRIGLIQVRRGVVGLDVGL